MKKQLFTANRIMEYINDSEWSTVCPLFLLCTNENALRINSVRNHWHEAKQGCMEVFVDKLTRIVIVSCPFLWLGCFGQWPQNCIIKHHNFRQLHNITSCTIFID